MTLTPLLVDSEQDAKPASESLAATRYRYVSLVGGGGWRMVIGAALALAAVVVSMTRAGAHGMAGALATFMAFWLVAVALTDKYRHKYPYRYYSYLVGSHTKAAAVHAVLLGVAGLILAGRADFMPALWQAFAWFVLGDVLVSIPRRHQPLGRPFDPAVLKSRAVTAQAEPAADGGQPAGGQAAGQRTVADLEAELGPVVLDQLRAAVPGFHDGLTVLIVADRDAWKRGLSPAAPADLVVSTVPVNDLRRINKFVLACADVLRMGGHLVVRYQPLENRRAAMAQRFGRLFSLAFLLDFAWHRAGPKIPGVNRFYFAVTQGRRRALSKAEVWGRLSFCGLKVKAEAEDGASRVATAQRIAWPVTNRRPSYYPVVALTKVGLDGELVQTHKVRSMYPYSEFLQKQIFDASGLVGTGKFKNDFRLTEYGKFLRRHWIDELPQLYDWLRGDIKLVGMRATSPHFLSLYPEEFIRRYVLVKPGLVPPLFAEGTEGFDAIVEIEGRYLRDYERSPWRADAAVLWETFQAIVFKGVRSK